jgi:DNA-binding protein HU-beta
MRKQDLVKSISEQVGQSEAQTSAIVSAVFDTIEQSLAKGEDVAISGFGSFKVVDRPAREGRNPQTGEPMTIAARKSPTFTPGTQLKRSVNGGDGDDD